MNTPTRSEMLQLFLAGAASYQPEGLALDDGDPQVTLENLHRLLARGCVITDVLCRPTGALFLLSNGEQYYAPGLRVGQDGRPTEALAEIASEAGYGGLEELLDFYTAMPADYIGPLPSAESIESSDGNLQDAP